LKKKNIFTCEVLYMASPRFHYEPSPITLSFIMRILLQRLISFPAFSCGAQFHCEPSPTKLSFIRRLLLPSLQYLHSAHSPTKLNELGSGRTRKRSCERKKKVFKKVLTYHYIIATEEHIRVSL
jgi:hypothetical protein